MEKKHFVEVVLLCVILVFEGHCTQRVLCTSVTYDGKALVINGRRRILQSGSIHYPRTMPEVGLRFGFCFLNYWFGNVRYRSLHCMIVWFVMCKFRYGPSLLGKPRKGGLDVIETYVFWNYHEPVKGQVWSWAFLLTAQLLRSQLFLVVLVDGIVTGYLLLIHQLYELHSKPVCLLMSWRVSNG